jgi:hypothetical protein
MIDFADADASAASVLRDACMDGDDAPDVRTVCRRLGVRLELVPPHVLRGNHAARYSAIGDRIIRRRGLPSHIDAFVLGHELGHRYCRQAGRPLDDLEDRWCNAFAGALLVPSEPLSAQWRRGHDLADIIEAYPNVAPTCLALRLGEARLASTVVVQGRATRYVRAECPPSSEIVMLGVEAARLGRASRHGLAKAWRMPEVSRRAAVVIDSDSD